MSVLKNTHLCRARLGFNESVHLATVLAVSLVYSSVLFDCCGMFDRFL